MGLFGSCNIVAMAEIQHEVSELTAHACIGRASEIPRLTLFNYHFRECMVLSGFGRSVNTIPHLLIDYRIAGIFNYLATTIFWQ